MDRSGGFGLKKCIKTTVAANSRKLTNFQKGTKYYFESCQRFVFDYKECSFMTFSFLFMFAVNDEL